MASTTTDSETAARATLSLLETRLRRLEYLLNGVSEPNRTVESGSRDKSVKPTETVASRIQSLESDLNHLRQLDGLSGDLVRNIESLHSKAPEIFDTTPSSSSLSPTDLSTLSSTVVSHATLFPETASRLSSLQSLQIPSAEQSAKLIDLQPRINAAVEKQAQLEAEARRLRDRSARCLEWWVKVGVVGMGELWEEWEDRVHQVDMITKRMENRRIDREGYV